MENNTKMKLKDIGHTVIDWSSQVWALMKFQVLYMLGNQMSNLSFSNNILFLLLSITT
jgi:hypothetical protein